MAIANNTTQKIAAKNYLEKKIFNAK